MSNVVKFFSESWHEVTKEVTWPKLGDLQSSATLVLVASIIFAIVVGAIDFVFEKGLLFLFESI